MMKPVAPFFSEEIKTLCQEDKDLQEKVHKFENQEIWMKHNSGIFKIHASMPKEQVVTEKIKIQKCLDVG